MEKADLYFVLLTLVLVCMSASSLMPDGFQYCTGIELLVIMIHTYGASTQGLGRYIIPHALQLQGQH